MHSAVPARAGAAQVAPRSGRDPDGRALPGHGWCCGSVTLCEGLHSTVFACAGAVQVAPRAGRKPNMTSKVSMVSDAMRRGCTALLRRAQVQYRWHHAPGVTPTAALYLAMAAGLGAFLATAAGVLASYDSKLRAFVAELSGENGLTTPGKDE